MSHELFYTSAARGLRAGTSGFCTVAATVGLGPAWQQRLEAISGYKPLYPVGHPQAGANPVAYAHTLITVAGQTRSVLTRAAFAGADHTGRSNKFVHHLLPTDHERAPGGPAAVLRQPGVMADAFPGDPRLLTTGRPVPPINPAPAPADTWQNVTGDPAWAAALANVAAANPAAIVYVLYGRGTDVLALFDEALRLLPEPQRWAVTFNTYVTEPPATPCAWRGLIAGTSAAAMAKGTVIDLTNLDAASMSEGSLAEAARSGEITNADVVTVPAANLPQSMRVPSNVYFGGIRPSADLPSSEASSSKVIGRDNAIPLNVQLANESASQGKTKIVVALIISAAVLICATVVGVGVWLTKSSGVAIAGTQAQAPESPKPESPKPESPKPESPKPESPKPESPKPESPKPESPKPESPKPESPKPESPKPESPKPESPKPESPKPESPKPESPKPEAPKPEAPKPEAPKPEAPKPEAPKPEAPKPEAPKPEAPKPEAPKPEAPKPEAPKPEAPKPEAPKPEAPKPEAPKPEAPKPEAPKPEAPKPEAPKPEAPKPEAPKPEAPKPEAPKPEAPKPEAPKPEAPKPEAPKPEAPKPEAPKPEAPKPEAPKPEAPKPEAPNAATLAGDTTGMSGPKAINMNFATGVNVPRLYWNYKNDPQILLPDDGLIVTAFSCDKSNWTSDYDIGKPTLPITITHKSARLNVAEAPPLDKLSYSIGINDRVMRCDLAAQCASFVDEFRKVASGRQLSPAQINTNAANLTQLLNGQSQNISLRLTAKNKGAVVLVLTGSKETGKLVLKGEN